MQIVKLANENSDWGYDRIAGALDNIEFEISDTTVANILKKHGIEPSPERKCKTNWNQFIKSHLDVMWATDFFTVEILTPFGLITHYVLFFIHHKTRKVLIGGITTNPDGQWCEQIARNVTAYDGELTGAQYLIHDRDSKYTEKFDAIFKSIGCEAVKLPPRSPNLNAYAERWVRSVKDECLSKYILFSQKMLRYVLKEYIEHYHVERNHQGVNNTLLFPNEKIHNSGSITKSSRLGGLLNFYYRKAA
jgi:transposase InsO family protein